MQNRDKIIGTSFFVLLFILVIKFLFWQTSFYNSQPSVLSVVIDSVITAGLLYAAYWLSKKMTDDKSKKN